MRHRYIALAILAVAASWLALPTAALATTRPHVSLTASPHTVAIGGSIHLSGSVSHASSRSKSVVILKNVGGSWRKLTTAKLSSSHRFSVSVTLGAGTWRLEAEYRVGSTKVTSKGVKLYVRTWTHVACGWAHTVALRSDGSLWAWGDHDRGQLGLGAITADRDSPAEVDAGTTWQAVSCGYDFTVAIRSDGTLWAWGDNDTGELGLGDETQKDSPTEVEPGTTWQAVSCGYDDTVAVRSDGTLWGWGGDSDGELGLGGTSLKDSPTQIGTDAAWAAVSCGYGYTMALQTDGSLWGAGDNMDGELGLGATDEVDTFTAIATGQTWKGVSTSGTDWYTTAVRSDGTLWGCGHNDEYQLGLGNDASDPHTLTQIGSAGTWTASSCGYNFTLGVRADGTLWAWGSASAGELGLGTASEAETPAQVGGATTWKSVSCGLEQTLAIRSDGTLWAWGDGLFGSLGIGNWVDKDVPTEVK